MIHPAYAPGYREQPWFPPALPAPAPVAPPLPVPTTH